jgi:hypothetical protein
MYQTDRWLLWLISICIVGVVSTLITAGVLPSHRETVMFSGLILWPLCSLYIVLRGKLLRRTHKWYVAVRVLSLLLTVQFLGVVAVLVTLLLSAKK